MEIQVNMIPQVARRYQHNIAVNKTPSSKLVYKTVKKFHYRFLRTPLGNDMPKMEERLEMPEHRNWNLQN
jgi:hypothetical protein